MDKNQNKHERNNYKSQPQTNRELNKSIIYESKNSPPLGATTTPTPVHTQDLWQICIGFCATDTTILFQTPNFSGFSVNSDHWFSAVAVDSWDLKMGASY